MSVKEMPRRHQIKTRMIDTRANVFGITNLGCVVHSCSAKAAAAALAATWPPAKPNSQP